MIPFTYIKKLIKSSQKSLNWLTGDLFGKEYFLITHFCLQTEILSSRSYNTLKSGESEVIKDWGDQLKFHAWNFKIIVIQEL